METININGEEYVKASEGFKESEHVIIIADRGWIFEGRMSERYKLSNAHVVRKWSNGLGIGGLQSKTHKDDYTLDALPAGINVNPTSVIAVLPIAEW